MTGYEHMQLDLELLERADAGSVGLRVYRWDSVWVTLGYRQVPEIALVNPSAIPWAHRPTGGLAVLHGHDITVTIALPLSNTLRAYPVATKPLLSALMRQGIIASTSRGGSEIVSQDCFASTGRSDLVSEGNKVCGCALRRTKSAVLLQASIPVAPPLVSPESVITGGKEVSYLEIDEDRLRADLQSILQCRAC
ncbi:hypothetical protein BH11ARM1_BH11ARM1_14000 [soil metagenome]